MGFCASSNATGARAVVSSRSLARHPPHSHSETHVPGCRADARRRLSTQLRCSPRRPALRTSLQPLARAQPRACSQVAWCCAPPGRAYRCDPASARQHADAPRAEAGDVQREATRATAAKRRARRRAGGQVCPAPRSLHSFTGSQGPFLPGRAPDFWQTCPACLQVVVHKAALCLSQHHPKERDLSSRCSTDVEDGPDERSNASSIAAFQVPAHARGSLAVRKRVLPRRAAAASNMKESSSDDTTRSPDSVALSPSNEGITVTSAPPPDLPTIC